MWARSHSHRQPAGSCPALESRSLTIKKSFWSHDYRSVSGTATTGTDIEERRGGEHGTGEEETLHENGNTAT